MNHPWSGHGNMSTLLLWEILQDGLLTFWLPPRDSNPDMLIQSVFT